MVSFGGNWVENGMGNFGGKIGRTNWVDKMGGQISTTNFLTATISTGSGR